MFTDRLDAGQRLAQALSEYREDPATIVCGIPREGVVVAAETARRMGVETACLVVCKIGMPCFPEYTLGAIAPDGQVTFDPRSELTQHEVMRIGHSLRDALAQKVEKCRGGKPEPSFAGRTVIVVDEVVDEPIAAKAAAEYLRRRGADRLIMASVVMLESARRQLDEEYEKVVALRLDTTASGKRQVYSFPRRLTDSEIEAVMKAAM